MSERAARSCDGKRRYRSERRAIEAAKVTQKSNGQPYKTYPCEFCKGFHVGTVRVQAPEESLISREDRKQKYAQPRDRRTKLNFQRKPS